MAGICRHAEPQSGDEAIPSPLRDCFVASPLGVAGSSDLRLRFAPLTPAPGGAVPGGMLLAMTGVRDMASTRNL
jgi:hypothetical protein